MGSHHPFTPSKIHAGNNYFVSSSSFLAKKSHRLRSATWGLSDGLGLMDEQRRGGNFNYFFFGIIYLLEQNDADLNSSLSENCGWPIGQSSCLNGWFYFWEMLGFWPRVLCSLPAVPGKSPVRPGALGHYRYTIVLWLFWLYLLLYYSLAALGLFCRENRDRKWTNK